MKRSDSRLAANSGKKWLIIFFGGVLLFATVLWNARFLDEIEDETEHSFDFVMLPQLLRRKQSLRGWMIVWIPRIWLDLTRWPEWIIFQVRFLLNPQKWYC